jgi:hypothetical protein
MRISFEFSNFVFVPTNESINLFLHVLILSEFLDHEQLQYHRITIDEEEDGVVSNADIIYLVEIGEILHIIVSNVQPILIVIANILHELAVNNNSVCA